MGKITYLNRTQQNSDGDNTLITSDIDINNRNSLNTVFGEKIIGTRIPSFAAQFQYGIATDQAISELLNGGTATTENSLLKINTGTNAAGSAWIQTTDYLRYIPGHEAYINFTGVFSEPKANSYQRAGLFDSNNGFFLGYEGTDFCVTRRRDGTDFNHILNLSTIFEPQDGVLDPTKGNIYRISFGYLGFATINFEVLAPCGCWRLLHKLEYPNSEELTHILQTNLPARAEVANTGNTTDIQFGSGSYEVGIVDGGGTDPAARVFNKSIPETPISSGDFEIITFRNKDTYNSIENRITAQLILASAATDVNKINTWNIYVNSDFTNTPTWNDVSVDSVLEVSSDALIDTNTGFTQLTWEMGKVDTFFEDVTNLLVQLKPGQHATFVITTSLGASGDINLGVRWKELF